MNYSHKQPPIFDWRPRPWQQQVIDGQKPTTVIRCSRRAGKTDLCCYIGASALLSADKPINIGICSFSLKNAKQVLWARFLELLHPMPTYLQHVKAMDEIKNHQNGATARLHGLSAEHGDGIRGFSYDLLVLDEFIRIPHHIMENAARPTLTDRSGWMLAISTPGGSYDQMVALESECDENLDTHAKFWFPASKLVGQVPGLTTEFLASQRRRNPLTYSLEYEADITASATDTIFDTALLQHAATNDEPITSDSLAVHAGLDFAPRRDRSIMVIRNSRNIIDILELTYSADPYGFMRELKTLVSRYKIRFFAVDRGGAGELLSDMIEDQLLGFWPVEDARGVLGGERPYHDSNFNTRSELYALARDYVSYQPDSISLTIPLAQQLMNELSATTLKENDSGKFQVVPKATIVEKTGRSPDCADAFSLSLFHERGSESWQKPPSELDADDISKMSTAEILSTFAENYE